MKNTFGNAVQMTIFGESHGPYIGGVLDGLSSGVVIDRTYIDKLLALRRPKGLTGSPRREKDRYEIISGIIKNPQDGLEKTTGDPITMIIPNKDVDSSAYKEISARPRPGHADYASIIKSGGYCDLRGGGHFSGRLTAALVGLGAICRRTLETKGIYILSHVAKLGSVGDLLLKNEKLDPEKFKGLLKNLEKQDFPTISQEAGDLMKKEIAEAGNDGDSLGGALETIVFGLPAGLGLPFFDSLEGLISHAVFSVPGVKGISFGSGFDLAEMRGSQANDPLLIENERVSFKSNHNGGINGGISNGMPIIFNTVLKPTPSIKLEQDTVDLKNGENCKIRIRGRHDPAIVNRAVEPINAVLALVLCDQLQTRYGEGYFMEER